VVIASITTVLGPGGTLPGRQSEFIRKALAEHSGQEVTIEIRDAKRTIAQNRFLWGVVYAPIQRALSKAGHNASTEALHQFYKTRYLPQTVETIFGHEVVCDPKSSKLTRKEFAAFVDAILSDPETSEALAMAGEFVPDVEQYERRTKAKVV
jgi:hypothetical protein